MKTPGTVLAASEPVVADRTMERASLRPVKVLWHWIAMGPYHFARMSALAREPGVELTVIETSSLDDHSWQRSEADWPFELETLTAAPLSPAIYRETSEAYYDALRKAAPDVIVQSGYAEAHYRTALFRYRSLCPNVRTLLWSETTAFDHKRRWLAEKYKSLILSHFDGALVAGAPHVRYLRDLGMPADTITVIGGTVDNEFFSAAADALRASASSGSRPVPVPYFLYVGRFVPQKNLPFLLRAFHLYRVMSPGLAHDLVLVGSGPEETGLRALIRDLRIDGVHVAGNKQAEELPAWYAFASAFVLPSTSEPWGLVVNEAMASSLPVLASTACGAAEDLVIPGETGYLFDPHRTEEVARCFGKIAADPQSARAMGERARQKVSAFSLPLYASRITEHLNKPSANSRGGSKQPGMLMKVLGYCERILS